MILLQNENFKKLNCIRLLNDMSQFALTENMENCFWCLIFLYIINSI